jgi:glutamate---cysteine ligase / carboxylate-amine ligase
MRTVGVEEELLLVDPVSGEPLSAAATVLRVDQHRSEGAATDHPEEEQVGGTLEGELHQQQLETDTRPHTDLGELAMELLAWRRRAGDAARAGGARVAALATSPLPVTPRTTPTDRYLRMAERFGLTQAEQLTCGCHVHVSVESPEEGVAVLDRVRVWLPVLTALSANSPYWQGQDSHYASYRSQAWGRWPSAGPIEVQGSVQRYRSMVSTLLGTGVLLDEAMAYFDARLSARYPTVEIRVADVCLRAEDAVLLAALCRGLVETAAEEARHGGDAPAVPSALLRLATWRAGRSGVDDVLVDPEDWRPRPAPEVVTALLDHVRPALERSGDLARVEAGLDDVLARGTGAGHQRAVLARSGRLSDVVLDAVELTCG